MIELILELVLLAILIFSAYYGYRRGFIRIAAKPLGAILRVCLSLSLCNFVGREIIAPVIQAPITNYLKEHLLARSVNISGEPTVDNLPTLLKIAAAVFNVSLDNGAVYSSEEFVGGLLTSLTSPAVILISVVIAFLLLLLAMKPLLWLATAIVNSVFDVGLMGKINRIMGVILAAALSFCAAWAFVTVLDFLFHAPIFDGVEQIRSLNGGPLYRLFNSISPIGLLLSF